MSDTYDDTETEPEADDTEDLTPTDGEDPQPPYEPPIGHTWASWTDR
ncbi:hypothetical protein [Streptomyces turgidiscabies]|nr:hypothetical protein [Streptomyces turgidiscabies]